MRKELVETLIYLKAYKLALKLVNFYLGCSISFMEECYLKNTLPDLKWQAKRSWF